MVQPWQDLTVDPTLGDPPMGSTNNIWYVCWVCQTDSWFSFHHNAKYANFYEYHIFLAGTERRWLQGTSKLCRVNLRTFIHLHFLSLRPDFKTLDQFSYFNEVAWNQVHSECNGHRQC